MHEYHAVESVVGEIRKKAEESGAIKIKVVTLVLGNLLGFAEESVRLYFETLAEDELFSGTELRIREAQGSKEFYIDNIEVEM